MTHLSRVIWSWQPSPSDLKSSHSVAIKQPSNNCRCGCRTLRTIGRVTGTKWDAGWYISTSWHPGLPPPDGWGEGDEVEPEEAQSITARGRRWRPQEAFDHSGVRRWQPLTIVASRLLQSHIYLGPTRKVLQIGQPAQQLNMPWCHLEIRNHPGTTYIVQVFEHLASCSNALQWKNAAILGNKVPNLIPPSWCLRGLRKLLWWFKTPMWYRECFSFCSLTLCSILKYISRIQIMV